MNKWLVTTFLSAALLAGCRGGSASVPATAMATSPQFVSGSASANALDTIPEAYRCFPSSLPAPPVADNGTEAPAIAYAAACLVSAAAERVNLQSMAIAPVRLQGDPASARYSYYCSGTPISYDPKTGLGFVVTAAHCVTSGSPNKAQNTSIAPSNITTFETVGQSPNARAYVYQGVDGASIPADAVTGTIAAVYIPSQYCFLPLIRNGNCTSLYELDGDVAVLEIKTNPGKRLDVMPKLRLAPKALTMPSGSYILGLGYGAASPSSNYPRLRYITYQYFGTDSFQGVTAAKTIENGYLSNGNYYSIICPGDSGGGDLYWDGTYWNLVGAHSLASAPCGAWGPAYHNARNLSADIRPFTEWIDKITTTERSATGCKDLGPTYVCRARS